MPSNTTNLGLYKKNPSTDGNDTFDITTMLNDNWDKIDTQWGAQMTATPAATSISLNPGIQVVNATNTAPFHLTGLKGRTLVNLLGRDGNCEDLSKWNLYGGAVSSLTLDSSNKVYGSSSIKMTIVSGTFGGISKSVGSLLTNNKYYILLADVKNGNGTNLEVWINSSPRSGGGTINATTFTTGWCKFQYNGSGDTIVVNVNGTSGQYAYVDGVRLFEITQAEYNSLGSTLTDTLQIASKYPYVQDVKHVNAPYLIKYGVNLMPPFHEWNVNVNARVQDPYSLTLNTALSTEQSSYVDVPVVPNQAYTLSSTGGGKFKLSFLKSDYSVAKLETLLTDGSKTFTVPDNVFLVRVFATNLLSFTNEQDPNSYAYGAVNYTITNPVLNLGSDSKPFKFRNDDMLIFPNVQLASSSTNQVYDQIFHQDGKYFIMHRFQKDFSIDGSLVCSFSADFTGFKRVQLSLPANLSASNSIMVKYDGKILKYDQAVSSAADTFAIDATPSLYVTITDSESGWGETYTPSSGEIQAYFYGWRMCDSVNNANPYTSGTKTWVYKDVLGNWIGPTTTLPITASPAMRAVGAYGGVYKLTCQLITPAVEELAVESGVTLHEGLNQIECGAALIAKEKPGIASSRWINAINASKGLKYETTKLLQVFKNGYSDRSWFFSSNQYNNKWYAFAETNSFDSNAIYEVTYIASSQNGISVNIPGVTGEYACNLKSALEGLTVRGADQEARIGAVESLTRKLYLVPQVTGASTTLFVDAATGSDANDGSAITPLKTIQAALNRVPQIINHAVTIQVAPGTYAEDIVFSGWTGRGSVSLQGGTDLISAASYKVSSMRVLNCALPVKIIGFELTKTGAYAVQISSSVGTNLASIKINTAFDGVYAGIVCESSTVWISQSSVSNRTYGILANWMSTVYSDSNTGSGNTTGLGASRGSVLAKNSTQPAGTTAEFTGAGGSIRS